MHGQQNIKIIFVCLNNTKFTQSYSVGVKTSGYKFRDFVSLSICVSYTFCLAMNISSNSGFCYLYDCFISQVLVWHYYEAT